MKRNPASAQLSAALRNVVCGLTLAVLALGCGSDSSSTSVQSQPTVPRSAGAPQATSATGADVSIPPDPRDTAPSLDELGALVHRTVALPRLSFVQEVTQALVLNDSLPVLTRMTGSFDDDTFSGIGSRVFEETGTQANDELEGRAFEFRLVDETFWFYTPLGGAPGWAGFDLVDYAEFAGGSPLGTMDGDLGLEVLLEATIAIQEVRDTDAGSEWILVVRADDLAPLVSGGGAAARLAGRGATDSGLNAKVRLSESTDGYISGWEADLSEWWTNALSLVDEVPGGKYGMNVEFDFEIFDDSLVAEAPCSDPTEGTEDGIAALLCDADA